MKGLRKLVKQMYGDGRFPSQSERPVTAKPWEWHDWCVPGRTKEARVPGTE